MSLTESSHERWHDFPYLEAIVKLGEDEIQVGNSSRGQVVLCNVGNGPIEFQSDQPLLASLLDPVTLEKVGGYTGWTAGTGLMIRLDPGDKATIPVLIGTATTKNDRTSYLSPGDYLVRVNVPLYELRLDREGNERSYLNLPLVRVKVVDRSLRQI